MKKKHLGLSLDEKIDLSLKQGRAIYGVDMKIVDDVPATTCHGMVRPLVISSCAGPGLRRDILKVRAVDAVDDDDWFDTGDVATIDADGYMQITDRSKDVIKSGGEWISSIDLENEAVGCPGVAEAAVIAVPHPKWDERPLLIAVKEPGATVTKEDVIAHLAGSLAKWQLPDDVIFVDQLPHTATGKILKTKLRGEYKDYQLPTITKVGRTCLQRPFRAIPTFISYVDLADRASSGQGGPNRLAGAKNTHLMIR